MKKLLFVLLLVLAVAFTASAEISAVTPDVDFAYDVTLTIAEMGDNADIGNRSAGSAAELASAEFIEKTMNEIGLSNVTVDEVTVDNWSFNRGRVYYNDASGEQQYIVLGGFATNLTTDMQTVTLVDGGRGRAQDYGDRDVTGKVVLIDINQAEEWWIEVPAYEAFTRGALAVLACNDGGYAYYDEDTLGSQDFCGPESAPTFSVTMNAAKTLRGLIEAGNGEAEVILDVDSVVTRDGKTRNIWGEIPGTTDEVIYFFAHYDGYYHSFWDDASGVGSMLSIAKALVESGETPDKTIRFVAHGAEEWGAADTEYDWSQGAFKQITEAHPEWAEKGFVILNCDGMYPIEGHKAYTVAATYELEDFAEDSAFNAIYDGTAYTVHVNSPTTAWTEDFSYVRAGIPSLVASHAEPEEVYHGPAYHSDKDNVALGVDKDAWQLFLNLFAGYTSELDALAVRPLEFEERIEEMEKAYTGDAIDFSRVKAAAEIVDDKIESMNEAYAAAIAAGDSESAAAIREEGIALNAAMVPVFKDMIAATIGFDWEDNTIFAFELIDSNIEALEGAIECLENNDIETALDEYLYGIDYNWYAYDFSKESYDYLLDKMYTKAEGTWGEGMIRYPGENLWNEIHSLMDKADDENADVSEELNVLKAALERQQANHAENDAKIAADLDAVAAQLEAL